MAWRDGQTVFVDYESSVESPGRTRAAWMDAALSAGVSEHDMLIVARGESE